MSACLMIALTVVFVPAALVVIYGVYRWTSAVMRTRRRGPSVLPVSRSRRAFSHVIGVAAAAVIAVPLAILLFIGWRSASPCDMDYYGLRRAPALTFVCAR